MAGRRYLYVMAIAATVMTALGCLTLWLYNVLPCDWRGYMPGRYLAYCDAGEFGDYEHSALYFGTEPDATAHIRAADVVILGNSRAQHAFSTEAVEAFFAKRNLKFYVLGFAYGENMRFAGALIDKLHIHPKMLIINADPGFFDEGYSQPSSDILKGSWPIWARAWLIHDFQAVHEPICAHIPLLCRPWARQPAIYRSIENGEWKWQGTFADAGKAYSPVTPMKQLPEAPEKLPQQIARAERFISNLQMDKRCVVLTGIPNSYSQAEEWAEKIGAAIDVASVAPVMDGLMTIDGSHLNQPSAERWSTLFLAEFSPALEDCLSR
jgi:hypothetical protein